MTSGDNTPQQQQQQQQQRTQQGSAHVPSNKNTTDPAQASSPSSPPSHTTEEEEEQKQVFVNYLQGVASEGQAAQRALHQIESNTPVQESFREYVTYVANSPRLHRGAANAPNNTLGNNAPSTPTLAVPAGSGAGGTPTPTGPNTPLAQYLPYMRTNPPQVNSAPPAPRGAHHGGTSSSSSSAARAPHTVAGVKRGRRGEHTTTETGDSVSPPLDADRSRARRHLDMAAASSSQQAQTVAGTGTQGSGTQGKSGALRASLVRGLGPRTSLAWTSATRDVRGVRR